MDNYTKLYKSIITSTVWQENNTTRILWITMLAMSDAEGMVEGSIPGLARLAGITIDECEEAINTLSKPDKYSRTQTHEGRRIEAVDGGWLILNRVKYRDKPNSRAEYYRKWRRDSQNVARNIVQHSATQCNANETQKEEEKEEEVKKKKPPYNPPAGGMFEQFWKIYPRKIGKGKALESFQKLSPNDELFATIIAAVQQQSKSEQWQQNNGQFIPMPSTWLNQQRWGDELPMRKKTRIEKLNEQYAARSKNNE